MIQTPVIVTFANQKGGVGKTSLCVTFANYLVMKGVRVVVIDCDFQHSILKCRKADLKHYGEEQIPYEVWSHEPNSSEAMITLIEKLHNDPGIDVVLMDSPGSQNQQAGMAELVIPYPNYPNFSQLRFCFCYKRSQVFSRFLPSFFPIFFCQIGKMLGANVPHKFTQFIFFGMMIAESALFLYPFGF